MEWFFSLCSLGLLKETPAIISTTPTAASQGARGRTAQHQDTPVLKMMNAQGYLVCNLICYTHYRCRSSRETRHSLHISGEMGNRYLSLGKDRIAGRKQMDMHFMPPFLWANSSITPPPTPGTYPCLLSFERNVHKRCLKTFMGTHVIFMCIS